VKLVRCAFRLKRLIFGLPANDPRAVCVASENTAAPDEGHARATITVRTPRLADHV
jgi:hypothetical protein